jgi:diguanylate cyclase (GGDEF)-like protein/PAS domain S-box-containing protein
MKPKAESKEAARLEALRQCNILDTAAEEQFDDLTRLASLLCRTPVALISLVDKDRVWFKSRIGYKPKEIPRVGAFCTHAIRQTDLLVVGDTPKDERFKTSPLVNSEPYARFYAGMPLVTSEGHALGTLCVIDAIPRKLNQEQREALKVIARQVALLLESRRTCPSLPEDERKTAGRKLSQESQNAYEARLRCVVDHNITGISFSDLEGTISEANDAFFKMVGYSRDDLDGKLNWRQITPKEHRHFDEQAIENIKASGACEPFEKEYTRKDGSRIPVLFSAALLSGSREEVVCFSLDLTQYKQAQERVNYFAYHDALTNLPNQTLFKDRLQQALALARRGEQMVAVILVNIDRFKTINETLGYVTADKLLREVAERLVSCVRESDTVARFGGDEFALLLTQVNLTEDATKIARNIQDALAAQFSFDNQELFVTTSMGISVYPYDAKDAVTVLQNAGTALNRAKELDGNNYQFYTSGRTTKALRQLVLENNLRPALEREEFIVHYQPQVNIKTFQLVGMEALVRWQHPGLGLLYPSEFIRLAEDSGLIISIGEWVLLSACKQSKSWQDAGFDPVRLAVNLSARQFQQPKMVETVAQILKETGLDARFLELELTEGSVMKDPDQAIERLHELKAMGMQISIDDFGTGYSSLSYLKRFPIDTLKVDQSFVSDINTDSDDAAIVAAIITLAHALELNVIAEGVETQEQLEFLRLLKCDEVQGFLFGKALSVEEFTDLLIERRGLTSRGNYSTSPLPSLSGTLQPTG